MFALLAAVSVTGCGTDAPEPEPTPRAAAVEVVAAPAVRGRAPAAVDGIPSVVQLTPVGEPAAPASADVPVLVIDQFGLAFSPRAAVVRAGGVVRFTNSEGALTHNVHVRSIVGDSTVYNGDTSPGDIAEVRLPAGGYDVLCEMHPGMTAFLFATEAPFATVAGADGTFRLESVPDGEYRARVWTLTDGDSEERTLVVRGGEAEIDLGGSG